MKQSTKNRAERDQLLADVEAFCEEVRPIERSKFSVDAVTPNCFGQGVIGKTCGFVESMKEPMRSSNSRSRPAYWARSMRRFSKQ